LYDDNWPADEKGPEPHLARYPAFEKAISRIVSSRAVRAFGRAYREQIAPLLRDVVLFLFPHWIYNRKVQHFQDVGHLYDLLDNEESRALLVKLFAYRIMGHKHVRLPRNNPEHRAFLRKMQELPIVGPPVKVRFMDLSLELRDMSPIGFNMKTYCTTGGGSYVFLQKQYEYHCGNVHCAAEQDEVVIDAGACWGETSLYFSSRVGGAGHVISFEFIPSNLEVLEQNISVNPELGERITVVRKPIWNEANKTLYYVDWGPGSRVSFEKLRADFEDTRCETTTIDQIVVELGVVRLDMIKMDIEGAELNALQGAAKSIRKFRPKLAISLYHNVQDFVTVPQFLASLGVPYKYYLEHHTIYENETVLFAIPQDRQRGPD
jgi:FkbM family methyltransferase